MSVIAGKSQTHGSSCNLPKESLDHGKADTIGRPLHQTHLGPIWLIGLTLCREHKQRRLASCTVARHGREVSQPTTGEIGSLVLVPHLCRAICRPACLTFSCTVKPKLAVGALHVAGHLCASHLAP